MFSGVFESWELTRGAGHLPGTGLGIPLFTGLSPVYSDGASSDHPIISTFLNAPVSMAQVPGGHESRPGLKIRICTSEIMLT